MKSFNAVVLVDGELTDKVYTAEDAQAAYDEATEDGFVMDIADPETGSAVLHMWQGGCSDHGDECPGPDKK